MTIGLIDACIVMCAGSRRLGRGAGAAGAGEAADPDDEDEGEDDVEADDEEVLAAYLPRRGGRACLMLS